MRIIVSDADLATLPGDVERLTPKRAQAILEAIEGDRLEGAYALSFVGLRAAEILGLARSDVHLDSMSLTIRHQLARSGRTALLVPTKTAASAATVPLPGFVVERLRMHLERQDGERPFVPIDDALLFVTEGGYAINGSWFTKHFQALLERAGLPQMRLHDMRHGAASLLVGAGAHPRVAQELLRHAPGQQDDDGEVRARHCGTAAGCRRPPRSGSGMGPDPVSHQVSHRPEEGIVASRPEWAFHEGKLAPAVGFEPTTMRLTAARSTTELRRNAFHVARPGDLTPRTCGPPR